MILLHGYLISINHGWGDKKINGENIRMEESG